MKIAVDKNQLTGSHGFSNRRKHSQMERLGAVLIPLRVPFGDYCLVTDEMQAIIDELGDEAHKKDFLPYVKLSIDTKKNLGEVCQNVCQGHGRFRRELIKPMQEADAKLVLLIEEEFECLEDVIWWDNPRLKHNPKAVKGEQLYKSLCTIRDRYNVDIQFCSRADTGRKIIEILRKGGEANGEKE